VRYFCYCNMSWVAGAAGAGGSFSRLGVDPGTAAGSRLHSRQQHAPRPAPPVPSQRPQQFGGRGGVAASAAVAVGVPSYPENKRRSIDKLDTLGTQPVRAEWCLLHWLDRRL
jgi:hypothetical protein